MKRKIVLSLICILFMGISTLSNVTVGHSATENHVTTDGLNSESMFYHIHYDGQEHEVVINDSTSLTLSGWTDEEQTSVNGKIVSVTDSVPLSKDVTLSVSEEVNELILTETDSINYQITVSDSFKVEMVENHTLNENTNTSPTPDTVEESGTETENTEITSAENNNKVVEESDQKSSDLNSQTPETTVELTKDTQSVSEEPVEEESSNVRTQKMMTASIQTNAISSLTYTTHVQDYGWQTPVPNGEISGTIGEAKRLEAIEIFGIPEISYRTHVQDYGWQGFVSSGVSGTVGKAKSLEAIEIKLTGDSANKYDIYYRVHAQDFGWLGWAKNGQSAGTVGHAKQLEAIEIRLVTKGGQAPGSMNNSFITLPSVTYSTHVENKGWMNFVKDGAVSGTQGEAKQVEAIQVKLENASFPGNIVYSTHVQDKGWLPNVSNGEISGTTGENKRVEAITISLTDELANHYDIYYRAHVQDYGWLGWAKNGQSAGTAGLTKQIESVQIKLTPKGGKAPGSTSNPFVVDPSVSYSTHVEYKGWMNFVEDGAVSGTIGEVKQVEAIKIQLKNAPYPGNVVYSTHVQDYGWLPNVSNGQISGTTGKNKSVEAITIDLTGEMADHYDIYYRAHVQDYGWLGWAKNGMKAGSQGAAKQLEAIEIKLVPEGQGEQVYEAEAFKLPTQTTYNKYNLTLNDAIRIQMALTNPYPQTDIDPVAYIESGLADIYGSITGFGVNLRVLPNLNSPVGAFVVNGTKFTVLDDNVTGDTFQDSSRWFKINYNGQTLYVHSKLAKIDYALVTKDGVRIQEQPNTNSYTFATVNSGSQHTILDVGDSWHKIIYDTRSMRIPSQAELSYYIDPTNFINHEKQVYQFMDISKPAGVSVNVLNQYLKGKGVLDGKGQIFLNASRDYGINEVYLIAHALLETGNGTSELAKGVSINGSIVHNVYGAGAVDGNAVQKGAEKAFELGWTDVDKAITGGAKWIKERYLNRGQNTIYEMRWNPLSMATSGSASMQYASDIGWAYKQINSLYTIMNDVQKTQPYTLYLEIPVYK